MSSKPCIPCLLCKKLYSEADIVSGLYNGTTMICARCYWKRYKRQVGDDCFGKNVYDPAAPECRTICLDRAVCKRFRKVEYRRTMKELTRTKQ